MQKHPRPVSRFTPRPNDGPRAPKTTAPRVLTFTSRAAKPLDPAAELCAAFGVNYNTLIAHASAVLDVEEANGCRLSPAGRRILLTTLCQRH